MAALSDSRPHPRVLYLCEYPTLLGGERSLLTLLSWSPRIAAGVVAPGGGRLAERLESLGVPRVDWPQGGKHNAANLAGAVLDLNADIVHANSLMTAQAAAFLGTETGKPAVAHVRDIMNLSQNKWRAVESLDAVVAVSQAVADWLAQHLPAEKVHQIYNAVDADGLRAAADRERVRRELQLNPGDVLASCIGQIALRKGQDLFLESCRLLSATDRRLVFAVVGERYSAKPESVQFEQQLRETACAPPLAGRTFWLGYRDDAPSILAATDVLVVPSRQEPLSRVLLEALALGVPAVATDVGGSAEILDHGSCGLLASPTPESLAEAVQRLLESPQLRDQFRQSGPERVAQQFSVAMHAARIYSLYDRLADQRTGSMG